MNRLLLGLSFENPAFLDQMNRLYANSMPDMVEELVRQKGEDYLGQLRWGEYQRIFVPGAWPGDLDKIWDEAVLSARESLARQPTGLPPDAPQTKCELLDAAVRHCFVNKASGQKRRGIPIFIHVKTKDAAAASPTEHDIELGWLVDAGWKPARLLLTMVCPAAGRSGGQ